MIYPNPPIQEAIFDVRVENIRIAQIEDLEQFHDLIKEAYPKKRKKYNLTSSIHFEPDKAVDSKTESDLIGYVFLNELESRQIQVRLDGFTLNIINSYENWEIHISEFLYYWDQYNTSFKPLKISRIATRFINKISLPFPFISFQEYLTIIPPIPVSLPQAFTNFFLQIHVPSSDNIRNCIITETFEPPSKSILPFILDIDVFQEKEIENSEINLKSNFNMIRKIKNEIFESCITSKTRELFK